MRCFAFRDFFGCYRYLNGGILLLASLNRCPAIHDRSMDRVSEMAHILDGDRSVVMPSKDIIGMWIHIILNDRRPTNAKHFVIYVGMKDLNSSP